MKRKLLFLILIALCFVSGCGDEGVLLEDIVATAPSAEAVIGPVPIETQEIIWGKDIPTLMEELEDFLEKDFDGFAEKRIAQICLRREQEAYYLKYINAGGVAIMGHKTVDDRFFYAARDIVLGMTQKRPELRALLTPSRENRPGATRRDGTHDVTGLATPSRKFRYILYEQNMGRNSIPEKHLNPSFSEPQWTPTRVPGHCSTSYCYQVVHLQKGALSLSDVFLHEFAHAIHFAIRLIDPTFEDRLQAAYDEAVKNANSANNPDGQGYWVSGQYALSNPGEYWAETVKAWFHRLAAPDTPEVIRAKLRDGNPLGHALLEEWFDFLYLREVDWRDY